MAYLDSSAYFRTRGEVMGFSADDVKFLVADFGNFGEFAQSSHFIPGVISGPDDAFVAAVVTLVGARPQDEIWRGLVGFTSKRGRSSLQTRRLVLNVLTMTPLAKCHESRK